ncbi:MAG: hypothetical protein SWQ30_16470 [Thermodesulfobacteriota bacterium]|nr:hypothetical protein [Thermodesulfobacteriota bacterium]
MKKILQRFQNLARALLHILCFPYIAYLGLKKEDALKSADWEKLIANLQTTQKFGVLSPRDLFLLGYAHSSLGRMDEAIKFMEIISTSLEDVDEEACRYCTHAWLLHKVGKLQESKAILEHSVSEKWPAYRIKWAEDFLDSVQGDRFSSDVAFIPKLSLH